MSTRREFLKIFGSTVLTCPSLPVLLGGCAGLATVRVQVEENRIVLSKTRAKALTQPNGILLVQALPQPGSIILRNLPEFGIIAVLSTCTHRGCEVRPLPHSLQCPCHGSEYDEFGEVLEGPATQPLKQYKVEETTESIIIEV